MDFAEFANKVGGLEPQTVKMPHPGGKELVTLKLRAPQGVEGVELEAELASVVAMFPQGEDEVASPEAASAAGRLAVRWTAKLVEPPMTEEAVAKALSQCGGGLLVFDALTKMFPAREVSASEADHFRDADRT